MRPHAGTERRRDYRFRLRRAMEYMVLHQAVRESVLGPAMRTDVSRRDLGLVVVQAVPLGTFMEVYLLAGDGRAKVSGLVEVVRCVRRGSATEYFNEYYNPDAMVEYELGLRSPGSVLFDRVVDIA